MTPAQLGLLRELVRFDGRPGAWRRRRTLLDLDLGGFVKPRRLTVAAEGVRWDLTDKGEKALGQGSRTQGDATKQRVWCSRRHWFAGAATCRRCGAKNLKAF